MTSVSKNVFIDKIDNIVNKYGNTYHRAFKINDVDVKSSRSFDFNKEDNNKDLKFNVYDHLNNILPTYMF